MSHPGTLTAAFALPRAGVWQLWLAGQIMPAVRVAIDGRPLGTISGQLAGNSLVADTMPPIRARLQGGPHHLSITRTGFSLAPGNGGAAVLDRAFLARAGTPGRRLLTLPSAGWRVLCGQRWLWLEALGG